MGFSATGEWGRQLNSFWTKFRAWDRDFGWTYRTAIFVGLLSAVISAPFWIFRSGKTSHSASPEGRTYSQTASLAADSSSDRALAFAVGGAQNAGPINQRPLYPYSIIPGGAYSREELTRAVQNDPVVARHYADFEIGKTRVVRLEHDELMYVSYRMGNNVFWTKHPLFVPAGETLLTDGKNAARTRCGNRLSATPATPVSAIEPRPEAMDAPPILGQPVDRMARPELSLLLPPTALFPVPGTPMALVAPANEGPATSLASPIPPLVFPFVGGGGGGAGAPIVPPILPPPVATPEPGTIALLLTGLAVIVFFCRWKLRVERREQ
jgi:hypothetical protein